MPGAGTARSHANPASATVTERTPCPRLPRPLGSASHLASAVTPFPQILTNPSNTAGPGGELKQAIESEFGSIDAFKEKFNAAATTRFGSGWAWLVATPDGKLAVTSTPNQDNPLQAGIVDQAGTPILGLDVWEHAYVRRCFLFGVGRCLGLFMLSRRVYGLAGHVCVSQCKGPATATIDRCSALAAPADTPQYLKYQNRRPEYISAWWNVVNWEQAEENFKGAK